MTTHSEKYGTKLESALSDIIAALREPLALALQDGYYGNVDMSLAVEDGRQARIKISSGRLVKLNRPADE